jgi:hypothetical protein
MLFLAGIHVHTVKAFYDDGGDDRLNLIGGSGGVSEYMWRLQLRCAPSYCGRVRHYGTEIATQPPYQHCAAEGICH